MYDHIVLVSIDTLRADGVAANPVRLWKAKHGLERTMRTDALDELTLAGAFFPNAITSAPYTSAAHASVLTGLWPPHHGVYEFFNRRLRVPTLFTTARRHGFSTMLKTDFPLILGSYLGFDRDVDRLIVEDDDAALDFIRGAGISCSLVHFGSVHIPYGFHTLRHAGAAYRAKVDELEREVGGRFVMPADRMSETFRSNDDVELLLRYKRVIEILYAAGAYDRLLDLYLEGVEFFAASRLAPFLERLFDALSGTRSLVVLFGDHGEEYDETAFGHFNSIDEGVARVPLVFVGDEIAPAMIPHRCRTIDIAPTIAELQGWAAPGRAYDGASLGPMLMADDHPSSRRAFCQCWVGRATGTLKAQQRALARGRKTGRVPHILYREAVYDGDFKLTRRHFVPGTENRNPVRCEPVVTVERVAVATLPEPVALSDAHAGLVRLLDTYGQPASAAPGDINVPEELRMQLRDLGYQL